jgi:nucleotide-binding universal stress UspA family protein
MSHPIRTIVAGVSELAPDDFTLGVAAQLAHACGAELHLVHAFEMPPLFASPGLEFVRGEEWEAYMEGLRRALASSVRGHPAGERAVCHVVAGSPARALLQLAGELRAGLLVVGAGSHGRLGGAFLGTVAQRVLRGAAAPVFVARRPLPCAPERVLLTGDLSAASAAVHEQALDVAEALFGAPRALRSLLVVPFPPVPYPLEAPPMVGDVLAESARGDLDGVLAARRARELPVEPVVRMGEPAVEIVAEAAAWSADLLVVGTHARGWVPRLVLGSVAEAALCHAPCNVLAIPPRALVAEDVFAGLTVEEDARREPAFA